MVQVSTGRVVQLAVTILIVLTQK